MHIAARNNQYIDPMVVDNRHHFAISRRLCLYHKVGQLYCYFKTDYSAAAKYCVIHNTFLDALEFHVVDFFERKILKKSLGLHMPRGCGELDNRRFTNLMMMWHFQYC